ncbi:MAG TPA: hypothetical protein PLR71_11460, partial [Deltaproteobacteria bacterium]|nr:hypothetical protein [Deltaproteobacteria bacterium]
MADLKTRHWETLALLRAVGEPADSDLVSALVPLSPTELQDFLRAGFDAGLVLIHSDGRIALTRDLPHEVIRKLTRITTREHLSGLIERIRRLGLQESLPGRALVSLLAKAGRDHEAAVFAGESAR